MGGPPKEYERRGLLLGGIREQFSSLDKANLEKRWRPCQITYQWLRF
jgi:hypothetical protein